MRYFEGSAEDTWSLLVFYQRYAYIYVENKHALNRITHAHGFVAHWFKSTCPGDSNLAWLKSTFDKQT